MATNRNFGSDESSRRSGYQHTAAKDSNFNPSSGTGGAFNGSQRKKDVYYRDAPGYPKDGEGVKGREDYMEMSRKRRS